MILAPSLASAQDLAPVASPSLATPDSVLRREAGRLGVTLAARRTQPARLFLRLQVEVQDAGSLVDRSRTLDLTWLRTPALRALRVRFRAPQGLAGKAILLRAKGEERRAWRHDPTRSQSEPCAWPRGAQDLGGTGLRWEDLWEPDLGAWRFRLEGEERLTLADESVRVLRVQGLGPQGAARLVRLERERRLPICVEALVNKERRRLWRWQWTQEGEHWIPLRWRVTTPTRTSQVYVRERRLEAPEAHVDPSRFPRD